MPPHSYKRIVYAALLFFSFLIVNFKTLYSQQVTFRSFTYQGEIRDLLVNSGDIWAATGGGVFAYDISLNTFSILNNTSGLSSNNPSSFVVDSQNRLWIGMDDGSLNVVNLDDISIRRVQIDPDPVRINDIAILGDVLYLALDFGISEFLISKEEIRATFRNLGSFVTNTPVRRLFIANDRIWAGTERGVASGELSSPNLQDPQFWENFTTADGLPSNDVSGFTEDGGVIYAGTKNGVAAIVNGNVSGEGLGGITINRLENLDGVIHAATNLGVYRRVSAASWSELTQRLSNVNTVVFDENELVWAGHQKEGLFVYNEPQQLWLNVFPPGPGGNTFEEMTFDNAGNVWFATGQVSNNGIYKFDGSGWTHFTTADGLVSNNTTGAATGPTGRIWVGTPGQGLMILDDSSGDLVVTLIDTTDGRLGGAAAPGFVIVNKIIRGEGGYMWIVNKFVDNGNAIAVVSPQNEWNYFSLSDGLTNTAVNDIAFDLLGKLWIATENNGVDRLDFGGTVGNKSDDTWTHYTTEDDLNSNRITALAADREIGMWIGTEEGINYFIDGLPIQSIRGAIGDFVTVITVDPTNNKWFGTREGVSMLASDNLTWTHFTTDNSDIVDNSIISITFDENNGDAYIGTGKGLSKIMTPFKTPPETFDEIIVYPNPFIIGGSGARLTIANIQINSTVLISSLSGNIVRKLTPESGEVAGTQAFWDGRDDEQRLVPSGIYFITAGVSGVGSGTQKVAVIRR